MFPIVSIFRFSQRIELQYVGNPTPCSVTILTELTGSIISQQTQIYSIYYGKEVASLSVSDVDSYVIIKNVP